MKPLDVIKISENIDKIALADIEEHKVFGSNYYVYCDGVEIEKCFGTKSLNSDSPITNRSIFRLASMTKPITAVATLILVERGVLSLDDKVDKFIPEFKNIKIIDTKGNISTPNQLPTIKNILTHTSGIASIPEKVTTMTSDDRINLDTSISWYVKKGLDYEPGTMQIYSGSSAFNVLTKIIEIVTKTDYLTFLKKEIFEPCEMVDTTFIPNAEQQERMVDMHQKENGENTIFTMPTGCIFENYPCTHYLGGAGLVSTLKDYVKFAKMLLNNGKTDTGRILKPESVKLLCTPQVSKEIMPIRERWGLGVRVITEDVYPCLPVSAFGWSGAYGSHFWIDQKNNLVAVFMKNSKFDGGAGNQSAVNFEKAVYSLS